MNMPRANDKRWLFIGIPLIIGCAGLIAWLNIYGQPTIDGTDHKAVFKGIQVSTSAPEWVNSTTLALAKTKLDGYFVFPEEYSHSGDVVQLCTHEDFTYPCRPGYVMVFTLTDKIAECDMEDCHAGRAVYDLAGPNPHCTIWVPDSVKDMLPTDEIGELEQTQLPEQVEEKAFTHELVHCMSGNGEHVKTQVANGVVAIKSGSLMSPSVLQIGWGMDGLEPLQ